MSYFSAIENLMNNILADFDQVYHSVELITIDQNRIPGYPLDDEYINLSPTDEREIIYIRKTGDDQVSSELKISSCGKAYNMSTPVRIVYFRDHAPQHGKIIAQLMQAVLSESIRLVKISTDKWKIQKDESSGDYRFGAKTAYFAIDIKVEWILIPDQCEQDFCVSVDNPYKLCTV